MGGYTFLSLGTVTWHNTYAPPGRGPGLAKLLLTSKTPSVAPAIPGPRRSPPDPRRHRQCAPVGLVAPIFGLLLVCHHAQWGYFSSVIVISHHPYTSFRITCWPTCEIIRVRMRLRAELSVGSNSHQPANFLGAAAAV